MADSLHALTGMAGLLALAWAASENRRAIPWRAVAVGTALLLILALVFLKIPLVKDAFL
ncbi:MAG: Na+ dependent nucleoside transporter N-terminus, partial [Burkholderiales bacterium]|nr:Na+ dependent nucleoside transporter N-terminus [Burkholderiales bacterium]